MGSGWEVTQLSFINYMMPLVFKAQRKKRKTLESESSSYIDMMLNPEKLNQYKMDVQKLEEDIRAEKK